MTSSSSSTVQKLSLFALTAMVVGSMADAGVVQPQEAEQ